MKAILIIDMPESCKQCQLKYIDTGDDVYFGGSTERCIIDKAEICLSGRYDDCPLKPMPQKSDGTFELTETLVSNTFKDGWNACLEELEGETE